MVTPQEKRRLWETYKNIHKPAFVLNPIDVWGGALYEATEAAQEMIYDSFHSDKVLRRVRNVRWPDFGRKHTISR